MFTYIPIARANPLLDVDVSPVGDVWDPCPMDKNPKDFLSMIFVHDPYPVDTGDVCSV